MRARRRARTSSIAVRQRDASLRQVVHSGHPRRAPADCVATPKHRELKAIAVIGHKDPIIKEWANQGLGLRNSRTMRQILIDGDIPANRRVVVSVDINKAE